jgi:hypothetical protein
MRASAQFNRPADTTAYADGDLIANSATAGSVAALTFTTSRIVGQGTISRVRFYKSQNTATNAQFTLHLFLEEPDVTNGDNGAFAIDTARNHIASIACDLSTGGLAGTAGLRDGVQARARCPPAVLLRAVAIGGLAYLTSANANRSRTAVSDGGSGRKLISAGKPVERTC